MFTTIDTGLNTINETAARGKALVDLIALYIPWLRKVYYGHRPIGAEDIQFPCAMVEPTKALAEMYTTGKFDVKWTFQIYFYILQEDRDALIVQQSAVMEALIKLFSNNALDDMGETTDPDAIQPRNSNRFKTYPGYWLNSEMRDMNFSSTFAWSRNDRPKWARAGLMVLELQDRVTK
jgi:hypothetical protein